MSYPMSIPPHQQLPPEAETLAKTYQLGTPLGIHRMRVKLAGAILVGIFFIFFGGIFGLAAIFILSPVTIVLSLIGMLFFMGFGIYIIAMPIISRSWRIYVCSDGFIFVRGNSKIIPFPWDQIDFMWQAVTRRYVNGIYVRTIYKYTVRRKDGDQVILDDRFADIEALGNKIATEMTRYQLPLAINSFNSGNTLTFGRLSVNLQGVSNGDRMLPWSQVRKIDIQQGTVKVLNENKWLSWSSARVANIPNIFVFMALVDYALQNQR